MVRMMLIESDSLQLSSFFSAAKSSCADPASKALWREVMNTHIYTRAQYMAPQHSFRPAATFLSSQFFFFTSLTTRAESSFAMGVSIFLKVRVVPAHLLDVLAEDKTVLCTRDAPRRTSRTLHPITHSFGVGCIGVSTPFTSTEGW